MPAPSADCPPISHRLQRALRDVNAEASKAWHSAPAPLIAENYNSQSSDEAAWAAAPVGAPAKPPSGGLGACLLVEELPGATVAAALGEARLAPADRASLATAIGVLIAALHSRANLIHGDLTTSNLLLRGKRTADGRAALTRPWAVAVLDFGLASVAPSAPAALAEDRAVDLYVLQRAIVAAHATSAEAAAEARAEADAEAAEAAAYEAADRTSAKREGDQNGDDVLGAIVDDAESGHGSATAAAAAAAESDITLAPRAAADPSTAAGFFSGILKAYLAALPDSADANTVAARFEAVRRRGRKRLAFG